jgi:hypothetical protein
MENSMIFSIMLNILVPTLREGTRVPHGGA